MNDAYKLLVIRISVMAASLRSFTPREPSTRSRRKTTTVFFFNDANACMAALWSLQVEEDCQLTSVDDIAAAVHGIVETIEQEQQQQQKQSCS